MKNESLRLLNIFILLWLPFSGASEAYTIDFDQEKNLCDGKNGYVLVVGNAYYEKIKPLPNAQNDAELVGRAFCSLNYTTDYWWNIRDDRARQKAGDDGLIEHLKKKADDEEYKVVILYFAGHGVSIDNQNYLLAITHNPLKKGSKYWSVANIQSAVGGAEKQSILFLDACRENYEYTSDERRFVEGNDESNTLIILAAQAGGYSWDGEEGEHGAFALALSEFLPDRNLNVQEIFAEVQDKVKDITRQQDLRDPDSGEKYIQSPQVLGDQPDRNFCLDRTDTCVTKKTIITAPNEKGKLAGSRIMGGAMLLSESYTDFAPFNEVQDQVSKRKYEAKTLGHMSADLHLGSFRAGIDFATGSSEGKDDYGDFDSDENDNWKVLIGWQWDFLRVGVGYGRGTTSFSGTFSVCADFDLECEYTPGDNDNQLIHADLDRRDIDVRVQTPNLFFTDKFFGNLGAEYTWTETTISYSQTPPSFTPMTDESGDGWGLFMELGYDNHPTSDAFIVSIFAGYKQYSFESFDIEPQIYGGIRAGFRFY